MATGSRKCPRCGATIPVNPGWVEWCEQCEWNLDPAFAPPRLSPAERLYRWLQLRHRESLFNELKQRATLERQWTVNLVLAFASAALVHATTGGLVVAGIGCIVATWPSWLGGLGGLVCWLCAWAVSPRWAGAPEDRLAEEDFPAIYALIRKVAGPILPRSVRHVVVNEEWNASYSEVGLRRQVCITLGLPLLAALNAEQMVALIAHEAAHGANQDLRRSWILGTAESTMVKWWRLLEPDELWPEGAGLHEAIARSLQCVLAQFPRAVASVLATLSYRDSQRAEYLADALGARIAGSEAMATLLDRLRLAPVFTLLVQRLALREPRGAELIQPLRAALDAVPARERQRLARVDRLREIQPDYSHPPRHLRIAMLEAHSASSAQVALALHEHAAVWDELRRLEPHLRRRLVDGYRSSLG